MTCSPKTDPHFKLEWWIEGRQGDEKEAVYTLGENPPLKLSITAIYPPLQNPFKRVDIDILALSKTLATCKVLVPSVRYNLISV
jgi:hypothetical protein